MMIRLYIQKQRWDHTDSLLPSYVANFILSLQEFMKTGARKKMLN